MEIDKNDRKDDDKQDSFNGLDEFISFILEKINSEISEDQPFVYGFSVIQNGGEKPSVFGIKVLPSEPEDKKDMFVDGLHPLVDIVECDDEVYVTIDTRQNEGNVSFESDPETVFVEIDLPDEIYSETIELPCSVEPSSAVSTCNNGVLDIRYSRLAVE
ncbi:HSP20 family protein [Methanohalophilus levihalophilus]|uniref:hypothetical protein n=1 Tax=Methanohalophilus levihalophilus TaxID=1431282 RepID=UPI001AE28C1A|nr:hypothetical protein [Methanohalophilus levihalophilus]MBP2029576.1 HSP20 family protein [Methanohalophilus levihalophilus]